CASIAWTVIRTCVSGVRLRRQPAKIVPAKPVGGAPRTVLVIRTVTSRCGSGSRVGRRTRSFAGDPPSGVGWVTARRATARAPSGRGGSGRSKVKSWPLVGAAGSAWGKQLNLRGAVGGSGRG